MRKLTFNFSGATISLKIFSCLLLCLVIFTHHVKAQVSTYVFSETTGTYTSITGGTQLVTTTGGATTFDTDGNSITLPTISQFRFNGTLITSVNMTADGSLWLNTTNGNSITTPISSSAVATGVIAGMGMDLRSTSIASQVYERRWQDDGTEVIFQWQNVARYLSDGVERFSFQIRVNKATNVIRVVYGNFTTIGTSTSYQPMVGLRGATNSDFNNRNLTASIPDATPNWGAPNGTAAGTANTQTCRFTTTSPSCVPTSGLIFTWTPPATIISSATTLSAFSSCINVASSAQTFTVQGYSLTNDITITAPAGFQVSSDGGTNWSANGGAITLPQASGLVATTTISVRMAALTSSPTAGNITISSSPATSRTVGVSGVVNSTGPSITTNPSNATVAVGANTSFTVVASGSPTSYTWQVSTDAGSNWSNVTNGGVYSNATTATLNLTAVTIGMNGYQYRASATNCVSTSANSTVATLTVNYCNPTYVTGGSTDFISNVSMTGSNGTLAQGTASNVSPYYINYTTTQNIIPQLRRGVTYNLNLTFSSDANQYNGVWIDFNNNGSFETTEFFTSNTNAGANGTVVVPVLIPVGATVGITRMRIRGGEDSQLTSGQACGASSSSYGQAQDFNVNIANPPAPVITTVSATSLCVGQSLTITGTDLLGATASNVTIGGIAVSSISSISNTQIVAIVAGGNGTVSVTTAGGSGTSTGSVNVQATPAVPAAIAATSLLPFSFDANWNTSSGATAYFLDVATDNTFTTIVSGYNGLNVGNVTTYSVTGLNSGTTYYYRVRATNGTCNSTNSGTITAITTTINSVATGNWNATSTWVGGVIPTCNDVVTIQSGHNVTVNSTSNVSKNLTINSGGTLTLVSGDLTVGCSLNNTPLTNNGTLAVNGGVLNVNGNLSCGSTSVFNQSGGSINIDGNNGGSTIGSVASGTPLLNLLQLNSGINWTGGTLTIVDPHTATTNTNAYALFYSNATTGNNYPTVNHTFQFGNGVSTDAGGNTSGFYINQWEDNAYIPFGNLIVNGPSGVNRGVNYVYSPQYTQGNITINSGGSLFGFTTFNLGGNLTVNSGGVFTNTGTLNTATLSSNTGTSTTPVAVSSPQSIGGSGTFQNAATSPTANIVNLTINNSSTSGVTISAPLSVSGTLTMTAGKINTTSTNILTLGTSSAAGTLAYTAGLIEGPFRRTFVASGTTTATYNATTLFPVGVGSTYLPLHIDPVNSAGVVQLTGQAFNTNSGVAGTGVANPLSTERWEALVSSGSANLTNCFVGIYDGDILNGRMIVQSSSATGTYNTITPTSTFVAASTPFPNGLRTNTSITSASYLGYFSHALRGPVITSFTPTSICENTSTSITITGTDLSGATSVTLNGETCTISNNTSTSITFITDVSPQAGNIVVTTPANSATSSSSVSLISSLSASVSISESANNICSGTSVTFTATPTNGGSTPTYQWNKNGLPIFGQTAVTYNATSGVDFVSGDIISCIMTSNATPCLVGSPATSNNVTMTVNPILTASVSISESANNICSGTSVTFTATPTNGGSTPTYQWNKNGLPIFGQTAVTYNATSGVDFVSGDIISCIMTSNATPCLVGSPATSNNVTMTVNPIITASVSISESANNICSGTSVTFTATPTNGGTSPAYVWMKNGTPIGGATGITYTGVAGTDFISSDQITCQLTSNATPCLVGSPATSNNVTMTVNPILTASVTIASSANPACLGNSVTFTATPTNGGTSPAYVWKNNGSPISGQTAATFNATAGVDFVSGDIISCEMTSNATPCLAGSPATSNGVTMTVNAAAPTNTPGTYTSTIVSHIDGTTQSYNFDNCTSLGQITDAAGGNVLGNTTMTSTVASSILTTNPSGYVYLRRGYTFAPASDGAMTLKMYFTQQDFDNYNATAVNFLSLPTSGSNADPNIPYFRIATVVGGVHTISGPLGATGLTWNGTHWEFTMNVTSVSGTQYYVATMPSCTGIAVNNLAATNVTTDAVTATWSSVVTTPSWGWYGFRYRVVGASTWIDAGTANNPATSRVINGLTPGTNYELQIRRHCSSQSEGPWSASVFFTTLGGGCGSPMIFNTATATASSVTLNWTAVTGAAWYEFEYKLSSSSTWISAGTLTGTGTNKTISGLAAGSTYNYRGRTYCTSGTPSPWSITGTVTTTTASGCALPPVISASTITGTSATINWPAVVGAAWYEFRYKQTSSGTWISAGTLGSTATSKVLSGLVGGTQYDFQARTYCSSGVPSAWSSTLQFTTSGLAACESAPVVSTSSVTGTSATITWPAISGAGWYEFRYKQTSSSTWITAGTLVGTATSKTITGLTSNTAYDFQAKTFCNSTSGSAWGSTLQFTTGVSAMILNDEVTVLEANSVNFIEKQVVLDAVEVKMYPNPTNAFVTIELNSNLANEDLLVKVIDMSGRLVQLINSKTIDGTNKIALDLSTMSNGVYTVELYKSNSIVSRTKIYKN